MIQNLEPIWMCILTFVIYFMIQKTEFLLSFVNKNQPYDT